MAQAGRSPTTSKHSLHIAALAAQIRADDPEYRRQLRGRMARAAQALIDILDAMDGDTDLELDLSDKEPDDTGIADLDALVLIERANPLWQAER